MMRGWQAGVASLLAMLLRQRGASGTKQLDVHAIAIAPVPTLPLRESVRHDALISGFVFGDDLVPHASLGSVAGLKRAIKLAATDDEDALHAHYASTPSDSVECLYPPGRVYQLERELLSAQPRGRPRRSPFARWRRRKPDHAHAEPCTPAPPPRRRPRSFARIRVHPSMARDHGFDRYEVALHRLLSEADDRAAHAHAREDRGEV
jgi:hypothetical protein